MDWSIEIVRFTFPIRVFSKVTVVVLPSFEMAALALTGFVKSITIRTYGVGASLRVTQRMFSNSAALAEEVKIGSRHMTAIKNPKSLRKTSHS